MVSIIIPALNEAQELPATLEKFAPELVQKFGLEIIVADGGSTDGTVDSAAQFGARVAALPRTEQETIGQGRNRGAQLAQGDILVFLDADTRPALVPYFLHRVGEAMVSRDTVAVNVRVEIAPEQANLRDRFWQTLFNVNFYLQTMVGAGSGRGNCQVIRTKAFWAVGGYNEKLAAAEDCELMRRLRRIGRIKFLWDVVVYESPRRFRRYGYWRVAWQWFINYWSMLLTGQARAKRWERVD